MKKLLLVLILFTAGCEHTAVESYTNVLNVFSVLKQGKSIQSVMVNRTYKLDEQSQKCIENAIVILSGKNFIDTLSLSDSLYISTDSIVLNPMDTINICVKADGFDSVCGTTVIPDSIIILHPTNNDTVNQLDSLVVKNTPNTYSHFTVYREDRDSIITERGSTESDSLLIGPFYWFDLKEGLYKVEVKLYDKNYTQYEGNRMGMMGSSGNTKRVGLNSGFGVFGSVVTKEIYLYFKE
ncbi:MAG: hypothetical protein WC614_09380 [bacterium]